MPSPLASVYADIINHTIVLVRLPGWVQAIARGERGVNVRATPGWEKVCPDVRAQVACLIDQATDPVIVATSYVGLALWL